MARSGFDLRPIFSHPFFLLSNLVALAGWWTAFIGQIVLESKREEPDPLGVLSVPITDQGRSAADHAQPNASGSVVGAPWFGIFLQMFINLGVFITLARGTLGSNRFQLSIFLAIAVVMAVIGVNSGIFNTTSFQLAVGSGWLMLAIVDILWLLYLTSEPNTFWPNLLDTGSSISFSSRISSAASTVGGGPGSTRRGAGGNASIMSRQHGNAIGSQSQLGMSHPGGSTAAVSYSGGGGYQGIKTPGSMHAHAQGQQHQQATMSVADLGMGGMENGALLDGHVDPNNGHVAPEYAVLKARALYSYSASPDDPNEISFAKGEILDILDNSGKWWQARKSDNTKGIVPSNYLVLV
ncbi:osmosensor SHO1 [Sporobolomyces koalae]|uniref:osmosensor SHO1 n=1 Tax=Sporobolomyces koalae TaxID=500713 RepID=UPI00317038A4